MARMRFTRSIYRRESTGALKYSLRRTNPVSKSVHLCSPPAQEHAFQAVLLIEMNMHGGYDHAMRFMLKACKPARKIVIVVIVEQRQHAGNKSLGGRGNFFRKFSAYAMAKSFGAIGKTLALCVNIESGKKFLFQRNAEAYKFVHTFS